MANTRYLLRITDVYLNSVVGDFGRNGLEACTGSMELWRRGADITDY